MFKLAGYAIALLFLFGCDASTSDAKESYVCVSTLNLQLGEKATYRFNIDGNISYLISEVVEENNESFTIAFKDGGEATEYFSWLKTCQSKETLDAVNEDPRKSLILTLSAMFKAEEMSSNLSDDQDTAATSWNVTYEELESYSVEAGTYSTVRKTLLTSEDEATSLVSSESYVKDIGNYSDINTPFAGLLKQQAVYKDGTSITVELIEWNDL